MKLFNHDIKMPGGGRLRSDDGEFVAVWQGAEIARSDHTIVVEGNHYFPPGDVNFDFFAPSEVQTTCPWKGLASYYDVVVDGERNPGAAWQYPEPKEAAAEIKDYVAFWNGVAVTPAA